MSQLFGRRVFLSASFPSGERGEQFRPYDVAAIADATTAVARAVLVAGGRLVFGAHPTISPLVLLVAGELGCYEAVEIHQSSYYEGKIPKATLDLVDLGLGVLYMWPRDPSADPGPSNKLMREKMFSSGLLSAAVFIGGMEGLVAEYEMLTEHKSDVPRLPVRAPGGAARRLEPSSDAVSDRVGPALNSPRYPAMAHEIVATLAH